MPSLHLALEEGFFNDAVVVTLNSREIFRKPAVSTRLQIGRADKIETEIAPGNNSIKVTLPARGLEAEFAVDGSRDTYAGVSLSPEGQLTWRMAEEPFGYV